MTLTQRSRTNLTRQGPSRSDQALIFARNFFKHPRMLGSLIPSSRFLIDEIVRGIDWEDARVIVEYGPGVGNITAELLERLRPDGKLIVIETNREFVNFLNKWFQDPRFHVVHGSAEDVREILTDLGEENADYVVSGIPFTHIPPKVRDGIVTETRDALRPGGRFIVYQFLRTVHRHLRKGFTDIDTAYEPFNIPGVHLFYCTRR
jgi:phospholipid N-methyltransferase